MVFVFPWTSPMKVHSMAKWHWLEHVRDREQLLRLKVLANVPLFAGLSRRQLGKLLVKFFEKEYPSGETIFREGEPGKALFVVLTGRVSICRSLEKEEELLATLTAGGYFEGILTKSIDAGLWRDAPSAMVDTPDTLNNSDPTPWSVLSTTKPKAR